MMPGEVRMSPSRRVIVCRHCKRTRLNRRAGLCWKCERTPAVRALYPSTSKFVQRGNGAANTTPPLPELPTAYQPGTVGKVFVMMQRVARGVQPHHPDDPRL